MTNKLVYEMQGSLVIRSELFFSFIRLGISLHLSKDVHCLSTHRSFIEVMYCQTPKPQLIESFRFLAVKFLVFCCCCSSGALFL
jgi:hypothetical protein